MTRDPFKLERDLISYVRNMPVGVKTAEVEHQLRTMLTGCGYEVPEPAVFSEAADPEHAGTTPFRLDPTVASMCVSDIEILIDDVLAEYIPSAVRGEAVSDLLGVLQP